VNASPASAASIARAEGWTLDLAGEVGPRRPTSHAERVAAEWLRDELARAGLPAKLEPFTAYSTFALPQATVLGLAVIAGLLPRRAQVLRSASAITAAALGALEDGLRFRPLSRVYARRPSQNIVATISPRQGARRTLCLMSHIDTSRSGWMFGPRLVPHLRTLITASSASVAIQALEPLLARAPGGRALAAASRVLPAIGLLLLGERELRGQDVPGANDNASGAAVTAALAAEVAAAPLDHTRLVLLVTGGEEAGVLGADAFLRAHDTDGWLFCNFDGVAAPATLRYLTHEGLVRTWPADPGLMRVAERIERDWPELGLRRMQRPAGLTYDATPVLAGGGRAITISAQDGTIPNYHQSTDDERNVDRDTVCRALDIGRLMIAAVDDGEADRQ
jgi:Peptidase family M28